LVVGLFAGARRKEPDEKIDHDAGIVLHKKVGDVVLKDEILCYIHTNIGGLIDKAKEDIKKAYVIE
jgi:thymidine phosphorylase